MQHPMRPRPFFSLSLRLSRRCRDGWDLAAAFAAVHEVKDGRRSGEHDASGKHGTLYVGEDG